MNNTHEEALDSKNALQDKVLNRIEVLQILGIETKNKNLTFELHYNIKEQFFIELFEVIKQKIIENSTWSAIVEYRQGNNSIPLDDQDLIANVFAKIRSNTWLIDKNLQEMGNSFKNTIDNGNKIVTVSHSQGNFYANEAYYALNDTTNPERTKSFGIVSVASPANHVAGGGQYRTLESDEFMNAVRFLFSRTLPANFVNNFYAETPDPKHHSFIKAYLQGNPSGADILEDIASTINELQDAPPENFTVESGDSQLALSWDAVQDADEYIIFWSTEPNVTPCAEASIISSTESYTHTGLENGVKYFYTVRARKNGFYYSAISNEISGTPKAEEEETPADVPTDTPTDTPDDPEISIVQTGDTISIVFTCISGCTGSFPHTFPITSYSSTGAISGEDFVNNSNIGDFNGTLLNSGQIDIGGTYYAKAYSWSMTGAFDSSRQGSGTAIAREGESGEQNFTWTGSY